MELAKTYYSQAAKLNPDNMRALYGLLLVSSDFFKALQSLFLLFYIFI